MGRTFSFLGDSISTYEGCNPAGFAVYYDEQKQSAAGLLSKRDTWWHIVADHFDAQVLANGSYSGSMVEGEGFPAAWSKRRIESLGPDGRWPDDIVVFVGINDYGWGGALAQAAGRSKATPHCTDIKDIAPAVAGKAPSDVLERFWQSYSRMLDEIACCYPGTRTWCCTLVAGREWGRKGPTHTWNLRGIPMSAYNDAIRASVDEHGCRLVDLASWGLDYEAMDGTHPTALGMRQIAAMALACMEGAAAPDQALFYGNSWRSEDLCPGKACLTCRWARGTGNAWSCVCDRPR